METENSKPLSVLIADLTFRLLSNCQKKEAGFASRFDISVASFRCLRHLHEHQEATVKQLAENMNLSSSRLTRIIDGLVKNQLVKRTEHQTDRRIFIISLTQKGKELADELYNNFNKLHEEIFSAIPSAKQEQIVESITEMLNSLDLWFEKDDFKKWEFLNNAEKYQIL